MDICNHCGKTIDTLPFKCKFCKMEYCTQCRLPETHNCSMLSNYKRHCHSKFKANVIELATEHSIINDRGTDIFIDDPISKSHHPTSDYTNIKSWFAYTKSWKKYATIILLILFVLYAVHQM